MSDWQSIPAGTLSHPYPKQSIFDVVLTAFVAEVEEQRRVVDRLQQQNTELQQEVYRLQKGEDK